MFHHIHLTITMWSSLKAIEYGGINTLLQTSQLVQVKWAYLRHCVDDDSNFIRTETDGINGSNSLEPYVEVQGSSRGKYAKLIKAAYEKD